MVPILLVNRVWWDRNQNTFHSLVAKLAKEFIQERKHKKHKNLVMLELDYGTPWGYFDGASQGSPTLCGAGSVFHLDHSHCFHLHFSTREGSNTKGELHALWTLFYFSKLNGVDRM